MKIFLNNKCVVTIFYIYESEMLNYFASLVDNNNKKRISDLHCFYFVLTVSFKT